MNCDQTLHLCKIFMEIRNGFNSFIIIIKIEFFIWTMKVITVQSKTHKYDFYSQFFFKQRTNWNTASTTNRNRIFSKSIFYSSCRCFICFTVDWRHVRFTTMM